MADKKTKRIPKRIGGVKIPKEVRRQGEALIDTVVEHARGPAGREMLAGALSMAAAATAAAVARNRSTREAPTPAQPKPATAARPEPEPSAADSAPPQGTTREPDFQAIADTIGKGAEQMLGRLFGTQRG